MGLFSLFSADIAVDLGTANTLMFMVGKLLQELLIIMIQTHQPYFN